MIDLAFSETSYQEIDLVAQRALHGEIADRLSGRLSIGDPVVMPLSAERVAADSELAEFVLQEADHSRYCLLHLVCTFRPDSKHDRNPFIRADLGVRFDADGARPIAWSLTPRQRTVRVPYKLHVALGAKLTFVEPTLDISSEGEREKVYIQSYGERQSDPEWRMRRTARQRIEGDESFSIVVKMPVEGAAEANVILGATIRDRVLGLVPYNAALPPTLETVSLAVH
jgi:hypothetical protein